MKYAIRPKHLESSSRKTTPLMLFMTIDGARFWKSIGISIPLEAWDRKNKKLKVSWPGAKQIDQLRISEDVRRLEALMSEKQLELAAEKRSVKASEVIKLLEAFKKGAVAGQEAKPAKKKQKNLLQYLEAFIPTALTRRNKHAKNDQERITKSTVSQYTQLLPILQNFYYWTGRSMSLRKIDIAWHDAFLEWGQNVELMGPATLGKHIKTLKRVCYYAKRDGLDVCPDVMNDEDFDKPRQPKNEVQYLNRDELQSIEALDLSENPLLERARDWLIIGCWTGLRVSDLGRLSMEMVNENEHGDKMIHITTQKTRKKVVVPIIKKVQDILDRHDGFPRTFTSGHNFNDGIKELAKLAGIDTPVKTMKAGKTLIQRRDEHGNTYQVEVDRKVEGTFEKWELLASHSCRRSFASNWYGYMPNQVIMGITGHSKEEDFLRYIGVTEEENAKKFLDLFREIRIQQGMV